MLLDTVNKCFDRDNKAAILIKRIYLMNTVSFVWYSLICCKKTYF